MLQRGLAILLSVCMLTGGISDMAYAMSPQVNVQTVSDMQDRSDDRDTAGNEDGIREGSGATGTDVSASDVG